MPPQLLTDLFQAYFDARRNKRNTINALCFEMDYEKNLFQLCEDIQNRTYQLGPSICFIVNHPVKREIFASNFRDRVVHHLIYNYISSIFEKNFIKDSYSCRVGKGTSYGIKRAAHFIRSCSQNYNRDCYILKLDIKGYFMAMDHNLLYQLIAKKLKNVKNANFDMDLIMYLIRKIIFHNPTKNCHVKTKKEGWIGLPRSKSLFYAKPGKGFPIGNLTSQLFGNIYLNEFDHFARKRLSCKYYGRYVDDIVIVHSNNEYLKSIIPVIKKYLKEKLDIMLHPNKIYLQYYKKGVQFLGTFIKPYCKYIGKRAKGNFFVKIYLSTTIPQEKFIAVANSYLGMMGHYNTFKLRKKMVGEISRVRVYYIDKDYKKISFK